MNKKRAQSSLEFLSMYGWAILIVLVSIGILARFGVLTPSTFLPQKCEVGTGLVCSDVLLTQDGYLFMKVSNNVGSDIYTSSFVFNSSNEMVNCALPDFIPGLLIPEGAEQVVTLDCFNEIEPGIRFDGELYSEYQSYQSQFTHVMRGTILTDSESVLGEEQIPRLYPDFDFGDLEEEEEDDGDDDGGAESVDWDARIEAALDSYDCPTPINHTVNSSYYQGTLIDSHLHIPTLDTVFSEEGTSPDTLFPILGVNVNMAQIVCTLSHEGTIRPLSYFPVYPNMAEYQLDLINQTKHLYPNEFIYFINYLGAEDGEPAIDGATLNATLYAYPGVFEGFGEISIHTGTGTSMYPNDPLLEDIYPVLAEHGIPIYIHPDIGHVDAFVDVLTRYPDVNFIVHGEGIENDVDSLMANHSNIYFTVNDLYGDLYLLHQGETTESFLSALEDFGPLLATDVATWKTRIETYPDQFIWGTDRGGVALWTFDIQVGQKLAEYGRAFIAELDPSVQEKFAYQNMESLFP